MRVIITGACGHIGSSLIRALPQMIPDLELVLVDNMLTQRYASLFHLPEKGRYEFLEADILRADLSEIFCDADAVVHLAAITDAAGSAKTPELVEEINFVGTQRVADACAEQGVNLIMLSTTSVYGKQADVVDEASEDCLVPQSPYAESKLKAERYLFDEGRKRGLKYVTLRFGTIFGPSPGMRFHTAVNKFIWQANLGLPITIWRTALDQKRPYLALDDAIRAIGFFLSAEKFDCEIYNVLTINATPAQIVEAIADEVPEPVINFVDSEIMNQLSYEVSSAKLAALGFICKGELQRGIADTFNYLRGIRSERRG